MNMWLRTPRAVIGLAVLVVVGCGRGTSQTSQENSTAAAPASAENTQAVTEYARPAKPSKSYRLGVSIPHLANPHYVGQAYGYIDEAQSLGAQVTLLEAGGYEHLDKQVSQVEDLIASKVDAIINAATSGPGTGGRVEVVTHDQDRVCGLCSERSHITTRVRTRPGSADAGDIRPQWSKIPVLAFGLLGSIPPPSIVIGVI